MVATIISRSKQALPETSSTPSYVGRHVDCRAVSSVSRAHCKGKVGYRKNVFPAGSGNSRAPAHCPLSLPIVEMTSLDLDTAGLSGVLDDVSSPLSQPQRSNALSNKITSVLASSFTDTEFRESLYYLNEEQIQNTAETRRRLRLDAQKEVIECNGDVIRDFGQVAEVSAMNTAQKGCN